MNKNMLESQMKLYGDTNASLADYLGISPQTLSSKKHRTGGRDFTRHEMDCIKKRYNLTADEMDEMFFM